MTQDEIIRMAREAGFEVVDGELRLYFDGSKALLKPNYMGTVVDGLKEFAALVATHEREKLAEQEPFDMDDHPPHRLCECRKCLEYFTDKAHKEALEHITDGSPCWCNPEMTYKDPSNGAEVWVHKELSMTKEEIIEACKNSLNIYSFTAEALEKLMEAVRVEAPVRTKDLTDDEIAEACGWKFGQPMYEWVIGLSRAVIAADREINK